MVNKDAPFHAHIYYTLEMRALAEALQRRLGEMKASGKIPQLLYVGQLLDRKVGPHPIPQFEIHFTNEILPILLPIIEASGLTALVHPLTDDDLADHTRLARWIGTPLELDLTPHHVAHLQSIAEVDATPDAHRDSPVSLRVDG